MALNPEDRSAGFQHNNVVAFINEKMAGHTKGPEFYLENISLSWEEVENKLRDILEDSAVPSQAKDACAWSSLALGMRFARRQSQLHGHRVHWLQDFTKLHKSAAEALASHLKELTAQQEMERKESVFQLRQTQANMAEMRKESDLLRWRLLRAELESPRKRTQIPEEPGLATGSGAGTEGAHEEEEEAGAAATSAAGTTGRRRRQKDAEGAEATKKLGRGPVHLPGAEEQKNYTSAHLIPIHSQRVHGPHSELQPHPDRCRGKAIKEGKAVSPLHCPKRQLRPVPPHPGSSSPGLGATAALGHRECGSAHARPRGGNVHNTGAVERLSSATARRLRVRRRACSEVQ
ncbi:testis-expressed protein 13B-like [Eumetopias jubatus]|uniref:testis-expressed protein 13B-like n=1 Tax=Eumetopias jubatus TaxID=34886 RepID=UPI0010171906|nr:testis-expressed protein 13B-like [Eumetopias jubatus]XP_027952293.1 testis-expressed protein 13B-like [Eumetopias jubatus]